MTRDEALKKAEWCLDMASELDKDPLIYVTEDMQYMSLRNLVLAEAGRGYIELAKMLDRH